MDFGDGNNMGGNENLGGMPLGPNQGESQIPMLQQHQQPQQQQQQQPQQQQQQQQQQPQPQVSGQGQGQGRPGLSAQQILTYLMRLDPEQRNAVISKNPQLRAFLVQIEQQRRLQIQRMQQQQQPNAAPNTTGIASTDSDLNNNTRPHPNTNPNAQQLPMQNQLSHMQQQQQKQQQLQQQQLQQQQQHQLQQQQQQQHRQQKMPQQFSPQNISGSIASMKTGSVSASHSPAELHTSTANPGFATSTEGNTAFSFGPTLQPTDLSNLPKDKIPRKPLQKKGMKKKALTGGPIPIGVGSDTIASPPLVRANPAIVSTQVPGNNLNPIPQPLQMHTTQQPVSTVPLNANGPTAHPGAVESKPSNETVLATEDPKGRFADFTNPLLQHPHEWSERLKKEDMEPSTDLKIYENIITKDLDYLKYASAIVNAAKENENKVNDKVGLNGKLFNRILKDLKFYQQVKAARMQSMKLPPEANGLTSNMWGDGYSGYGNGFTNGKIEFVFPENSKMKYTDENLNEDSENLYQDGESIPIRLEFDVDRDGFKLNDTFLWNSNDDDETLKVFVNELVKDYRIENNVSNVKQKILASIKEQIADLHPMVVNPNIDLRFPINLDITISNNQLVDRFDWDLMNQENSPEEFAETLCDEFALPNEFRTAIAHCIREQCQIYLKSLYMIGYKFDGGVIVSEDLKEFLRSGFDQNNVMMPRYLLSDFTPSVQELSIDNFERIIKERERESKRKKKGVTRVGRRGGFVLPDLSNMPKTFRTPLPTAIFPGGVAVVDNEHSAADADYTDIPIDIEVPADQLRRVHEKDVEEKRALELVRQDQLATRVWLARLRDRRMRGETLTATAQLVERVRRSSVKPDQHGSAHTAGAGDAADSADSAAVDSAMDVDMAGKDDIEADPDQDVKMENSEDVPLSEKTPTGRAQGLEPETGTDDAGSPELVVRLRFGWR